MNLKKLSYNLIISINIIAITFGIFISFEIFLKLLIGLIYINSFSIFLRLNNKNGDRK